MDTVVTEDKPAGREKDATVFIRLSSAHRAEFEAAAKAEDRTVANWLYRLGRLAVEREREAA